MAEFVGPAWLEPLEPRSLGIDQLGLRAPGLVIADALLPGFSNTTIHIRYYTLIAWMYARAGKRRRRALETAFVHTVRLHPHAQQPTGVIGITKVPVAKNGVLPLVSPKPLPSALDAQFYGPSALRLGLRGLDQNGEDACSQLGRELADAADVPAECVPELAATSYSEAAARKLGKLCLCTPPIGAERELLEEMLFRMTRRRAKSIERHDGARRRSLAVLLHVLGNPAGDIESEILQRFIDWARGRGGYEPPKALEEEAYGFAWQGVRWHFRHALETMWAGFGRLIRINPSAGVEISGFTSAVCAAARAGKALAPSPDARLGDVVAAQVERGRERTLRAYIEDRLHAEPALAMLCASVQLAALASGVPALENPDRFYGAFPALGQPDRVPVEQFARAYSPGLTVREWVHHLLDRYAVSQHFLTAGRKWAERRDAFFFHVEEDGYRLRVGEWNPDGGRTKIPAAVSLLQGLGLVSFDGTRWQSTAAGQGLLAEVLVDPGERMA